MQDNVIQFAPAAARLRARRIARLTALADAESWHNHYAGGIDDLWVGPYRFIGNVVALH